MTVKNNTLDPKINLDTPLTMLFSLNWEIVLYIAIFVVAVITRFYDLGGRVMSHDESLHTLYSWNLYAGKGYQHDPLMHGPFLFHITAFMYFLFGDNDFTARISTALLGTILVILPYWFRPWLGRIGALSASFMLLISPGILYYSRYIRHDIFISVWTVLMVLAFFQYMRTRGTRWLFIGAVSVALMLSTKEVSYIHGFIGVSFIGMTYLGENLSKANRQTLFYGLLGFILVLIAAIVYMTLQADTLRIVPPEGETGGFEPLAYTGIMTLIAGLLVGGLIVQLGVDHTNRPVTIALETLSTVAKVMGWSGILIWSVFNLIYGPLVSLISLLKILGPTMSFISIVDFAPFTPGLGLLDGIFSILPFSLLLYLFRSEIIRRIKSYWQLPITPTFLTVVLLTIITFVLRYILGGIFNILLYVPLLYLVGGTIIRRIESSWQYPIVRTFGSVVLLAIITFVLLHTTFFTNISGLYSGTIGEITYWLNQQEVQRGGQPWYYYLFLVPLYEFLPVFIGLIGGTTYLLLRKFPGHADPPPLSPGKPGQPAKGDAGSQSVSSSTAIHWASDGGTFASFVIYWTLIAFIIYSWAGEKMPWLTVHMTLPLIFLTGHVIQTVLNNFDWQKSRQRGGLLMGGAILLIPAGLAAIATTQPFRSQSLQSINDTSQFIAGLVVLLVLAGVIWYYSQQIGLMLALKTAFVTVLLVMILLTVRFGWLFNFVNFDYVNEMMVYAHASPDVKLVLNQIDDISRRTVGDKMIRIAYDNDSTWPLEWYMREYPNRVYYGENPTRDAMDSPIVIVGSANENKVKPYLEGQYTRFRYRLVWWPIEDYKNQTPQRLWNTYITGGPTPENPAENTPEAQEARLTSARENRRKMWNIIFYRNYEDYDLNEWPFVHRFFVYIRNDVLNEVWTYESGAVQLQVAGPSSNTDPYNGKRTETDALQLWGSNGAGDGQFTTPRSLAIGPDGSIYVADSGNHRIQVFDQNGNFLFKWGSEGSEPGQLNEPWGIAVGDDGTVFVADTWNHRVQVFSSTGQFITAFGSFVNVQHDAQAEPGGFWGPRDIALDAQGNLYVTDTGNKRIQKFTPAGEFLQAIGGGGIVPGTFEEPVGIDIDSHGNIYVADTWNSRIQKFDSNFNPLLQWDVVNAWESESVINKPYLTVDNQDRVVVSDPEGYRVIVYDGNTGEVLVAWGQYGQDLASFQLPVGLEFDSQGNLLIADSDNNRIMKFTVPSLGE